MSLPLSQSFGQTLDRVKVLILDPIILLLFAVAVIVFLWGVIQFIKNSNNEDGKKMGAQHMLWGVIGMAIMLSVYGIMNLIINTLTPYQPSNYLAPTSIPK